MILLEAKARGHSQADAAREIGAHQQQVSRWVAGASHPTWTHAVGLARYLGRDLPDVLVLLHAEHTGGATEAQVAEGSHAFIQAVNQLVERVNLLEQQIQSLGAEPR